MPYASAESQEEEKHVYLVLVVSSSFMERLHGWLCVYVWSVVLCLSLFLFSRAARNIFLV